MITVQIYLFSTIRARIGEKRLALEIPPGSTIQDLKEILAQMYPDAREAVMYMIAAVNKNFAADSTLLSDQDQVAFFPYVTGGK